MPFTVYKIKSLINDRFYIGVHKTDNPNDGYFGSGTVIRASIKKYGKKNFEKEVLFSYDNADGAYSKEIELINLELSNPHCMNISIGGRGGWSWDKNKKQSGVKDKDGNRFRVFSDDPRIASGELVSYSTGFKHSEETKRRMSESRTGLKWDPEYSARRKANPHKHTEENKKRISASKLGNSSLTGRHWFNDGKNNFALCDSDQRITLEGLRLGRITKYQRKSGYKLSETARKNISDAQADKKWYNDGTHTFFIKEDDKLITELGLSLGRKLNNRR